MITWSNGMTTGVPKVNLPDHVRLYEVELYSYGNRELWAAGVIAMPYFPIVRDHFRTHDEAFDFVVSVVTLLELKYPNLKCNNFSFLNRSNTNE